ncbi:TIGR03067 domain-containing protein [Gemmata sp. JC717]|uniref:TIGR03067 domain-containing protein n=1 Tax=Gemmata algarum TaxID=2975278 RepID=A0ABU5F727_9BACT|nr:TIGR03067 domain-containing protein [Gemmata algarum]MDY3556289.1 TIGR03067 domain-containing protein [Gemmata algarum]MDY3562928.1 TIGR03067 domain-containing protein [Gemmata algarum]
MKHLVLAFAVLVLALTSAAADEKGLKELEGTYKVTAAEKGGRAAQKELTDTATVTIKGDEFVMAFGPDDKKVGKIKVGTDDKLATIDLVPSDGPEKGKSFPGIYKLEKGELTLVFTEKSERPKLFPTDDAFKAEEDVIVLKLKKAEK